MTDTDVIVKNQATGMVGFRLKMGRDRNGIRIQARQAGFRTDKAALAEYRRLCRERDAQHPKPRLSDTPASCARSCSVFTASDGRNRNILALNSENAVLIHASLVHTDADPNADETRWPRLPMASGRRPQRRAR